MTYNFKQGVRASFQAFCNDTSLSGYKYLQEKRGILSFLLWTVTHVIFTLLTIFLVRSLWQGFMENPTVTSLETSNYPVTKVPFPGVSICDINKISKKKAENLATFIAASTKRNRTWILEHLKLLGHFYDFDLIYSKYVMEFQEVLDELPENYGIYNLLKLLSYDCQELLHDCYWKGAPVNCSEIFFLRLTFEGFCCNFNYVKRTSENLGNSTRQVLYGEAGYSKGLHVVIRNNPEDYFYTIISSIGAKVGVNFFIPTDYPDKSSGSLNENLIRAGSTNLMEVNPVTVRPMKSLVSFPINKRRCLFPHERLTDFGKYSESDCLVGCRVRSMLALCGCVPFMIPNKYKHLICNLTDIPCLHSHKNKFFSLAPSDEFDDLDSLNFEKQNALRCDQRCFPACGATVYDITTNMVPNLELSGFVNDSNVHIYYSKPFSNMYRQDVVYYWFEILSNFGGTFGLVVGFSLITLVELTLYCTYKVVVFSRHQPWTV